MRRAGDHILLFMFDNREEEDKILSSAPWSFDKYLVVLQWYDREVPIRALKFNTIPMWIQVHDIPMRFLNHKVAEKLCEVAGSMCREEDINEIDGGSFMRVRVIIDINKPLCRGRRFSSSQGEQGWVSFKYERLPNLCYWCRSLSPVDKDCELWIDSEGQLKKEEQAYGSWIRAPLFVKGRSPVIKVPGFYEARKMEKQRMSTEEPIASTVVVLGSQQVLVVVQTRNEERVVVQEERCDSDVGVGTEATFTLEIVGKS